MSAASPSSSSASPLWQKEDARAEDWVTRFTVGEDYRWDRLLLPYDVRATRAHTWGLMKAGVLSEDEWSTVSDHLDELLAAFEEGAVTVTPADEDCHTVLENYLTEALGEIGSKIHAGRSRNDQVLAALRLFLRDRIEGIGEHVAGVAERLCVLGEAYDDALMPGYTHLQRAMPTTAGLWALGYAEVLAGDLDTLQHVHRQVNVSPLGSAAGYGVPYLELPRQAVAERLGFRDVQLHAPAVQLTRGKMEAGVMHALVQIAATINRMAADLVLFNTAEFGFVALASEHCTGSSIMPQKQNPDVLELARASYHRLLARQQTLQTLPANLPSGYHRDLQLTKAAVMGGVLHMGDLLTAMRRVLEGVRFRREAMEEACTPELFATAHALEQVQDGVPFRSAYRKAAQELENLERPPADDVLRAYRADGFPGRGRPDQVRQRLAAHQDWMAPDS